MAKANFSFVNNLSQCEKNYNILILPQYLLYVSTHFRFSSAFPVTQLTDIMSYEVPVNNPSLGSISSYSPESSSVIIYNFHSLHSQDRFFVFTQPGHSNYSVSSVTEVYSAANWLEREVAELNGVTFAGKKDLRNLMLQYGDTSVPFQKSAPSIGYKEFYYDSVNDILIETPVTIQI